MSGRTWTEDAVRRLRDWVAGSDARLEFRPARAYDPCLTGSAGLYVHVPFCRSLCPYCPYLRQRHRADRVDSYAAALRREIDWHAGRLPGLRATSVYFGGGTPTVLDDRLEPIVAHLSERFQPTGPFCIETTPADVTPAAVQSLVRAGFTSVSLGVQSFDDDVLKRIGRNYTATHAEHVLDWLLRASIPSVNVDLMFAIPGQTPQSWQNDIERAVASGATQITAYPLFTFPYSSAGRRLELHRLRMPPLPLRRRMYFQLYDTLSEQGFRRDSVWSFSRAGSGSPFSSVTRDRYLGFGPGAGSFTGPQFTFNTFSLAEYQRSVAERGHAVALTMDMPRRLQLLHDVYWRLYETRVPLERHVEWLDYRLDDIPRLGLLLAAAKLLGMYRSDNGSLQLTRRGSFWLHWLQNYIALPAVDRLWSAGQATAWPDATAL